MTSSCDREPPYNRFENSPPGSVIAPNTLGAAEAGLSPGGLFLGKLLRRNPLPNSHDHRHHRRRIRIHEHDAGIAQLRIHLEICRNAGRAAVMTDDMFPIEY